MASTEVAKAMTGFDVVDTKLTVPVGTGDEDGRIIRESNRYRAAVVDIKQPDSNRKRTKGRKLIAAAGGNVRGKKVAIFDLTFEPSIDDVWDSLAIATVQKLKDAGAIVSGYDPECVENARRMMEIFLTPIVCAAAEAVDVAVPVIEWNELRALDFDHLETIVAPPISAALRNFYRSDEVQAHGLSITPFAPARQRSPLRIIDLSRMNAVSSFGSISHHHRLSGGVA